MVVATKFIENYNNDFPLKGDFIGSTQVYSRLVSYFESFMKLLRDTIGGFILNEWKHIDKENIVPVDETMLSEILRIQAEGFDSKNQKKLLKYSKKLRKIFYVIKKNRIGLQVTVYTT